MPADHPEARGPLRARPIERGVALLVALLCLAPLAVGAWLTPSPEGHGTHTQLGLPPCGWVIAMNKPCFACGMTTAVTQAAHGDFVKAFIVQPAGALFAICSAIGFWAALHVALTGSMLGPVCARMLRPLVLWAALGVVLAAWGYKVITW